MMKTANAKMIATGIVLAGLSVAGQASASTLFDAGIPAGWTCVGTCGTAGADGVVGLAPSGGAQYGYVSSAQGVYGAGLSYIGGTNASTLRSAAFSANAGDSLNFSFNYVTSDGAGYADYAWARLLNSSSNEVALLFTARTTPSGNSVPGFGLPTPAATMTPATVTIASGSTWSPLGGSSGGCYSTGCGHSGWVDSAYTVAATGNYTLEFGVANWADTAYDSGMAFDGVTIGGTPIEDNPVPIPAAAWLLGSGLLGLIGVARRKAV